MNAFMIILPFSMFMYTTSRQRALSFWHVIFIKVIDMVINFKSLSIVFPRKTSFIFVSIEEPSINSVDSSLQLKRR